MTVLEIFRAQYDECKNRVVHELSKYEWAAEYVFNLTTYDGELDKRIVSDIIEVCKVILENRNFEYIKDESNYIKYILVCQWLNEFNWINWGTSIRGAWFEIDVYYDWKTKDETIRSKAIIDELEWYDTDEHKIEAVPFTVENLKVLIEFIEEEE